MSVSDAAVEAAVGVSLRQLGLHGKPLPEGLLLARQSSIRELLEAALPHMGQHRTLQAGGEVKISDEAVEAAAKAVFLHSYPEGSGVSWDPDSPIAQGIKRDVTVALEVATPYMQQRASHGWTEQFPSFVLGRWRK